MTHPAAPAPPAAAPDAQPDDETLAFAARVFDLARHGDALEMRDLLAQGLPPDLRNDKGDSLLMLSAYNGNRALRARVARSRCRCQSAQ